MRLPTFHTKGPKQIKSKHAIRIKRNHRRRSESEKKKSNTLDEKRTQIKQKKKWK